MLTGSSSTSSRGRRVPRVTARGGRGVVRSAARREAPSLRLVGQQGGVRSAGQGGEPIQGMQDPRWALAVRVAEKMEGPILRPEHRQQLVRLGRMLGLSPFDCNLIIAIVQDQARRGYEPGYCPTAGEDQLRMIPLPKQATFWDVLRQRPALMVAGVLGTLICIELLLLQWLW